VALRANRKDTPDRASREPFEPQDQTAVPAEPAQRHADVGFARPKTVDHRGGFDSFLLAAKDAELSPRVLQLKRQIVKKRAVAA
jgi:hypothetical protein